MTPHQPRLFSVAKSRRRGPRLGRSLSTARLLPLAPGLLPRLVRLRMEVSGVNGRGKRQGARRRRLVCGSASAQPGPHLRGRRDGESSVAGLRYRPAASCSPAPRLHRRRTPPAHSLRQPPLDGALVPAQRRAQAGATRPQCRPSVRFRPKNTAFYGANTLDAQTIANPPMPINSAAAQLERHGSGGGPKRLRQAPRRACSRQDQSGRVQPL